MAKQTSVETSNRTGSAGFFYAFLAFKQTGLPDLLGERAKFPTILQDVDLKQIRIKCEGNRAYTKVAQGSFLWEMAGFIAHGGG